MTIQQGVIGGSAVYQETFATISNAFGLVNLEIGSGTVVIGDLANVDWSNGPYFIETAMDVTGGTSYSVMGTSQLMSVPYALHAKMADSVKSPCNLAIGDTYQGGIVFYLDPSGCHGLIVSPTDLSVASGWWNGTFYDTRAYGTGLFEGEVNTEVAQMLQGGTTNAVGMCYNYAGGGYTDWYLPSTYELKLMDRNIGQLNTLGLGNIGNFGDYTYWSSTEIQIYSCWSMEFSTGNYYEHNKNTSIAVRAVRSF